MLEESTAKTIILAGAGVGALVWVICFAFYRKMLALPDTMFKESEPIKGMDKAEMMKGVLKVLVNQLQAKILERSEFRVKAQAMLGTLDMSIQSGGGGLTLRTEFDFSRLKRTFGIIMGILVLIAQPVVIVGLSILLWNVAAPSLTPGVRWQVIQICQIIHVLWPPFLVYKLHGTFHRQLENLVETLPVKVEVS